MQKTGRLSSINRKVAKRLFIAWFILSLLSGAAVFYIETERIDDLVLHLAISESQAFSDNTISYIANPDAGRRKELEHSVAEHMESGHFLIVELYDRTGQEIAKVMSREGERIEGLLAHKGNEAEHMKVTPEYAKHFIEGRMYLRAYAPIMGAGGSPAGYFEGIYRVDPDTMEIIHSRLFFSLLLVIAVIALTTVVLYPVIIVLNKGLVRYSAQLSSANLGMLKILGAAVAKRDSGTASHSFRVTIYAIRLAEALSLRSAEMEGIIKGGFLHDIGKIAISDTILLKPGRLTEEEFAVMQTHVEHGIDLLKPYAWLRGALDIVRFHHERFDGKGYTAGLKGEKIPLSARIFSVVDYFDALTSTRPYRQEMPCREALESIQAESGLHFDPAIVNAFARIAQAVHAEIAHASEEELETILDRLIEKYLDLKP